jgi:hypothetical protein
MTYCVRSELSWRSNGLTFAGVLCWLLVVLSGCRGTGAKGGEVRESGAGTVYSACSAADPPASRSGNSGNVSFSLRGRSLSLKPTAAATRVRIAVFSGGGLGGAPPPEALQRLRDTRADVFVVLGGLGRSSAQAAATLRALASLARLTLLVRDGADSFELSQQTPDNAGLLLEASALRNVRIGQDNFLPWPGSEQGRYALGAPGYPGCGFGAEELKNATSELGPKEPGERRWLLSWQAPEPGSALAELVVRARIDGVLSAWPPQPDMADDAWDPMRPVLVPRAWGPSLEGLDGPVLPQGAVVLQLESTGPRVVR